MTETGLPVGPPDVTEAGSPGYVVRYGKFFVVGLTGFVVNLLVFTLVLQLIAPGSTAGLYASLTRLLTRTSSSLAAELLASAIAFVVATLWNFTFNSLWTFRARFRHRHSRGNRLALYFGVSLGSLAVNELVLFASSATLPPLYGQAIGIIAGSLVGFVGNARVTFTEVEVAEAG